MSGHKIYRAAFWLALLGAIFPQAASGQVPKADAKNSYTVEYTGRLFGYFRFPEVQLFNQQVCPTGRPTEPHTAANAFNQLISQVSPPGTMLRVAVGDNFAPFLFSRKMQDGDGNLLDKTDYEEDGKGGWIFFDNPDFSAQDEKYLSGRGDIPMDNVACFLSAMGFDAIVPGEQDFYFGPERLRQLARFLSETHYGTRMLASNLYIQPQYLNPSQTQISSGSDGGDTPKQAKSAKTKTRTDPAQPTVVLPKVVLPWIRTVTVRNAHKTGSPAITDVCFVRVNPPDISSSNPSLEDCRNATFHFTHADGEDGQPSQTEEKLEYRLPPGKPPVDPGKYKVYAITADGTVRNDPQEFVVQLPFLEYPATDGDLARLTPWVYKKADDGQAVAVFGVVGSTLLDGVSKLNALWLYARGSTIDSHREVDVETADTAEALKQVFGYCELDEKCKSARKVLLAQMPQQEAYDLIPRIKLPPGANPVDLIVAEADPDRATGDRELIRNLRTPQAPAPAVVLPGSDFTNAEPYVLHVQVNAATVIPVYGSGSREKQLIQNRVNPDDCRSDDSKPYDSTPHNPSCALGAQKDETQVQVSPVSSSKTIQGPADTIAGYATKPAKNAARSYAQFLSDSGFAGLATGTAAQAQWKSGIEQIALYAMRETCHADIAMIQHRDVFLPQEDLGALKVDHNQLYELMSAILWKGDYLVCENLSGATINSVLKASKQFQDDETNGLATDLTAGQGLATLGADVNATKDTDRVIDSQLIDPKRLYSVALTDHLATGATGYSMLNGAQPPPEVPWNKVKLRALSDVVAGMIEKHEPYRTTITGLEGLDRADLSNVVPTTSLKVLKQSFVYPAKPKQTGFFDWGKHLLFGYGADGQCGSQGKKSKQPCLEETAQQKPVWWIELYKADISYSLFLHNGSEKSIGQNFPGVTAVTLSTPESATKAADYIFRLEHDSRHFSEYFQSSLNYGYRVQRGTTSSEAYQPSQTADYWYQETGLGIRLSPMQASPSGLKAIVSAGVQTQPSRPFTQFSLSGYGFSGGVSSSSNAPPIPALRNIYSLQHMGLRYDFSYPKPANSTQAGAGASQGGGAGAGGSSAASSGGSGGKKGGGGSQSSSSGQGGGGQSQAQTLTTYIEFGYERGTVYHDVSQYNFAQAQTVLNGALVPDGAAPGSCGVVDITCLSKVLAAQKSESAAVAGLQGIQPVYAGTLASVVADRVHQQRGLYFNFRLDAPLPLLANSELVLENKGNWYPPDRDILVDTRLSEDFKTSLVVPIWQKISIAPTLEMFFFQNQVRAQLYHSYSTSLSLSYSFEWHNGLKWPRVFGYANPVPSQPTLPTR